NADILHTRCRLTSRISSTWLIATQRYNCTTTPKLTYVRPLQCYAAKGCKRVVWRAHYRPGAAFLNGGRPKRTCSKIPQMACDLRGNHGLCLKRFPSNRRKGYLIAQ